MNETFTQNLKWVSIKILKFSFAGKHHDVKIAPQIRKYLQCYYPEDSGSYLLKNHEDFPWVTTGSPMTDPIKVDTYYNYNGWKIFRTQTIFHFHRKVHFVCIMKNNFVIEDNVYFQDQSRIGYFSYFSWFLAIIMYQTSKNKHI